MKSVTFTTSGKLDACPGQDVVLCLTSDLAVGPSAYVLATLGAVDTVLSYCNTLYTYTFTYEQAQLLDPDTGLTSCDISGVIIDGCMLSYVRYLISLVNGGGGGPVNINNITFVQTEIELINAQTGANSTAVICDSFSLTANRTLTKATVMTPGCVIDCNGFTLNVNNTFSAGAQQCFTSTSDVNFGIGVVDKVHCVWFGARGDGTDATSAIQSALNSIVVTSGLAELAAVVSGTVALGAGRFLVSNTLLVPANVDFIGVNWLSSILEADGLIATQPVLRFIEPAGGQTHSSIQKMTISGSNIAGVVGVDFWYGAVASQLNFSKLRDCYICRCAIGAKVDSRSAGRYNIYCAIEDCVFESTTAGNISIWLANGVNQLIVTACNFFVGNNAWAIVSDITFFGDTINITNNSFDSGFNVDGAQVRFEGIAGNQGVALQFTNNRLEGEGIYLGTWITANITNNNFTSVRRGIYTDGRRNIIEGNNIQVRNDDTATLCLNGIEIDSNAQFTIVGKNSFGNFGEESYTPTPILDNGISSIIDPHRMEWTNTNGTHEIGDVYYNPSTDVNGAAIIGTCTVAGTERPIAPTTGDISALDLDHLTLANPVGYSRGEYITIVGNPGVYKIQSTNGAVVRIIPAATNPVVAAAVALSAPICRHVVHVPARGSTGNRPASYGTLDVNAVYVDTDLAAGGIPIWWTGGTWHKVDGSAA